MTVQVFDKATRASRQVRHLSLQGSGTGVLLYPRTFPTCDWVLYASGVVATGTYMLQAPGQ